MKFYIAIFVFTTLSLLPVAQCGEDHGGPLGKVLGILTHETPDSNCNDENGPKKDQSDKYPEKNEPKKGGIIGQIVDCNDENGPKKDQSDKYPEKNEPKKGGIIGQIVDGVVDFIEDLTRKGKKHCVYFIKVTTLI